MIRYARIGGIRFIRVGPLQLSFCVSHRPSRLPVVSESLDGVLAVLCLATVFVVAL